MKSRSKKRPTREPAKPTVSLQIRMDPALMAKFVAYVTDQGMSRTEWITMQVKEATK